MQATIRKWNTIADIVWRLSTKCLAVVTWSILQWFEITCLEFGIYFFIVWYIFSDNMGHGYCSITSIFMFFLSAASFHSHSKYNHCDFQLLTKSILKWAWLIFVCVCVREFKGWSGLNMPVFVLCFYICFSTSVLSCEATVVQEMWWLVYSLTCK